MIINRETDYAFRIIEYLAYHNSRVDAKTISENTCVSLRFTLKILRKLVIGGFVRSYKGVNGGYEICKDPKDITLMCLIECISGPIYFNKCMCNSNECILTDKKDACNFHSAFADINDTIIKKLSDYNFEYTKNDK